MEHQRVLIDTSILIDHLRKKQKQKTTFFKLAYNFDCVISAVTKFEFAVGTTPRNREFVEKLLASFPVLPFDALCAQTAVEIYHGLKAKNKLISLPDIFIAATALANDLTLYTLNRKDFERIENLKLGSKW
ncbi:MAG: type II toxin-antitoxin system VapC family toxin [Calditrichaeota bacterium]|nr:MAG: type II toxin-antitoxin system VapC family toxin [Calditrichota bacterium]